LKLSAEGIVRAAEALDVTPTPILLQLLTTNYDIFLCKPKL